jgi:hypothetical protein
MLSARRPIVAPENTYSSRLSASFLLDGGCSSDNRFLRAIVGMRSDRPAMLLGIIPSHTPQFADVDFEATTVKPHPYTWI